MRSVWARFFVAGELLAKLFPFGFLVEIAHIRSQVATVEKYSGSFTVRVRCRYVRSYCGRVL